MRGWILNALLLSVLAQADELCPWMNAATAGGILGGPVTLSVSHGTCTFTRPGHELKIEVADMANTKKEFGTYLARCGTRGVPLAAIGNAAFACSGEPGSLAVEQVVGRVRNQAFAVRITAPESSSPRRILRDQAAKAAEQVAGSLF